MLHDVSHWAPRGDDGGDAPRERTEAPGWAGWLAFACGAPMFTSVEAARAQHRRHHEHTNQPGDPYFELRARLGGPGTFAALLFAAPWSATRTVLGTLSLAVTPLRRPYASMLLGTAALEVETTTEVEAAARAEPPFTVALLVAIGLTIAWPRAMLLLWWLPIAWASLFSAIRFVSEHTAELAAGAARDEMLKVTRDHSTGRVSRTFLYPHFVGLHRAHHLAPSANVAELVRMSARPGQPRKGRAAWPRQPLPPPPDVSTAFRAFAYEGPEPTTAELASATVARRLAEEGPEAATTELAPRPVEPRDEETQLIPRADVIATPEEPADDATPVGRESVHLADKPPPTETVIVSPDLAFERIPTGKVPLAEPVTAPIVPTTAEPAPEPPDPATPATPTGR